jgi:hypothetical protein
MPARGETTAPVSCLEPHKAMKDSNPNRADTAAELASAEKARAALLARLEQLHRKPGGVRPPKSLQPTPEAAKSRVRRLHKKRLSIQRSTRVLAASQSLPPARDPLAP